MRLLLVLALLITVPAAITHAAPAPGQPRQVILQNRFVRRVLQYDGHTWRTTHFSRADGSDALDVQSDEFLIRLMDGTDLTVDQFVAGSIHTTHNPGNVQSVEIDYTPLPPLHNGGPTSVHVTYTLDTSPYLRKSLTVVTPPNGAVDRLEVERFHTTAPCAQGGFGEPVFIASKWFTGLEYPGSQTAFDNGLVTLAHFPGLAKEAAGQWTVRSKTAVIGVGQKDDPIDLAFSDYLDSIRQPARNLLHYNSWFDLRGKEVNPTNLLAAYDGFQKNLLEPYGIKMDSLVPDDGYQDPQSIWVPRKDIYPNGFGPLARALEARGTRLGLWLPFNGTNLDVAWGAAQGYEKSNQGNYYCLVGPKYNAALRTALKNIITQGNISYFKHDFNNLRCTAPGHGHLPDDRHGFEANLDAELDLMAYERRLQPGIFLNITSNVWFSPWWLQHADTIWMVADDSGYNKTWPQLSPREWDMSYRDHHLYGVYTRDHHLVPVSALMTHGIIKGRYNNLGGEDETLREWSDGVVMYYSRGVQLKELYITPSMIPAAWWKPLGEATRWAVVNHKILNQVKMVGGDVARGEIYGYAHFLKDRALITLRNPALATQSITLPFDKSVRYRGAPGRPFHARVIYPYVRELPETLVSGQPMSFSVPGASVVVYEITAGRARTSQPDPRFVSVPFSTEMPGADNRLTTRLRLPDEKMSRCDLMLVLRGGAGHVDEATDLKVNGQAVQSRRASGPGWMMYSVDVSSLAGKPVELSTELPATGAAAFQEPGQDVKLWLVADRPVHDEAAPRGAILPDPVAQGFRRDTQTLADVKSTPIPQKVRHLTTDDLRTARAAKLRIAVFGTDNGEQYRHKSIFLNGQPVAEVPANGVDEWSVHIVDLKPSQLPLIRLRNTIELNNAGGDSFKFSGLAIAVQLADGQWVQTPIDKGVYSSVDGWPYTEGAVFHGDRSAAIALDLP